LLSLSYFTLTGLDIILRFLSIIMSSLRDFFLSHSNVKVGAGFKPAPTWHGKHRFYWDFLKNQIVTKFNIPGTAKLQPKRV